MKKVINEENSIPIKLWLDDIDSIALSQAKNLARLPFAFRHIAIMPDSHAGYGMPIGGVLATKGVVIPNAVGVDIGCFDKHTKISILNGSCDTLGNLSKKDTKFYVYSLNEKKEIVPGLAKALLTRKNAKVMKVCISGGRVITCTPDHKFMLSSGKYKKAEDLQPFDSLMPLYRTYETRDGYEHLKAKKGTHVITHKMVAEYFLGKRKKHEVIHHKDGNWYNNTPGNIEYKNNRLHNREHSILNTVFDTKEFQIKRLSTLRKNGFYDEKYADKKKEMAIKNIAKYNKSSNKKAQDKLAGQRGKKYFIRDNKKYFKCSICKKECKGLGAFSRHIKIHEINHKVLWTKKLTRKIDVYCLQVEKYHNFALDAGIFVHNCGMGAIKTSLTEINTEQIKSILGKIRERIPVGMKHHKEKQDIKLMPCLYEVADKYNFEYNLHLPIVDDQFENARTQIGTLGSGNHFIEIQEGNDGHIWAMLHSGSRNLGKRICDYHNKIAKNLNERWHTKVDPKWDLAFLPVDTFEGQQYLAEMYYAVEFAQDSRDLMMERITEIFTEEFKGNFKVQECVNIAHNYAQLENHFGQNVWVHRKGAILAREHVVGIIPGSQGSKSYIVEGKGNRESFMSCSHGAGRIMGRGQAIRTLNLEEEKKKLDEQGIVHSIRNTDDLDEATGAYKDISVVMDNQKDLVDILVELTPRGVVKDTAKKRRRRKKK